MSLLIFRFWTATVLTLVKNGLKLLKDKALEIIPKYAIWKDWCTKLALLPIALSRLVLIYHFFAETYFCHLHVYLLACFYEIHFKFLTSHICFQLDDSKLWKQYNSASQEMMEQICNLEIVEPQKNPIKVCVMFYNIEICYRDCGEKKASFLAII